MYLRHAHARTPHSLPSGFLLHMLMLVSGNLPKLHTVPSGYYSCTRNF